MDFTLTINCNNAAFQDGDLHEELSRILQDIASRVSSGRSKGSAVDINGNTVGTFEIKD